MTDTSLSTRDGLPEALRVLVTEITPDTWEAHPQFGGMVQFWLERHMMFRKIIGQLRSETEGVLDHAVSFESYAPRLSRLGGLFVNELHGHHHIEDSHYFPQLITLDSRLERGFDILDADHKALDGLLNGFAEGANAVLQSNASTAREAVATLHADLQRLEGFLDRHLTDEEEIIVPVILKSGFQG